VPVCSFHTSTPTICAHSKDECALMIERSPTRVSVTTSGSGTESKLAVDRLGIVIASKAVVFGSKSSMFRSVRYDRPFSSERKASYRIVQAWGIFVPILTYQVFIAPNR
jgi:hypothetical protein